ncbi:MAG: PKD domain-containing protein, partial [Bacteroidota bacterium]
RQANLHCDLTPPPPTTNPISYHWDFGVNNATNDTSNQFAPTFTFPDTGSYLVRLIAIKNAGGGLSCTDTTYAYVYVYPTFDADFITGNVCEDSAAHFTSQIVSTHGNINLWNWRFGDGNTSTQSNPSHSYSSPGNYSVTLIGGNDLGCRDTAQKNITIHETPVAGFSFATTCINQPINFNNSTTGPVASTLWSFGNGGTDTQQNPTYTYTSTGIFNISLFVVSPNGCKDTSIQNLTVNPSPDVANNDTTICYGQSVQLHASGGTVYTWSPSTGLSDSTAANPIATPTPPSSATYSITAVNQFQCTASDAVTISFYAFTSVSAGPDTSVCLSGANFRDSVQISASGGANYQWSPASSLSSASLSNPIAKPISNTTYYVTATDINGCIGQDSVIVYVLDPVLDVILDESKNVCLNDTVYVNVISQGASNYVWTPTQFLLNANSYSPEFFPPISTVYTLSISNYCYSKSDSVRIIVLSLPVLSFNHLDSVCYGDSVQLSVTGAQTYQWDFDSSLSAFTIPNPVASPRISAFYYVNATDVNGCKNRDSTLVYVLPLPIVNAGNDTLIWRDTHAVLNGFTDASKYFWAPSSYLEDPLSLQTKAEITKSQSYVLFAENDLGCKNSDTVFITVEVNTFLLLPTAFSPNGDGVNDIFRIARYLNIDKLKDFSVYNRWGEMVFYTTNINDGWDGVYKSVEQELGVYVWQVVAQTKDFEEVVRKGNVTLLR